MVVNILVLVEDYPNLNNIYPMAYVHTRNKLYKEKYPNLVISVLSFKAINEYEWEGIKVYSEKDISKIGISYFDHIVSHAPNIKNHYRFIKKNSCTDVTFFIHGHEVLNVNRYYPKPYSWSKEKNNYLRSIYDFFKLKILSNFFIKNNGFKFIFVSKWMRDETLKCLKLNSLNNSHIIHNPINKVFVENRYISSCEKNTDFITIRPLNGSKYCVDIVYMLAKKFPQYQFKIVGRGDFFEHNEKLINIELDENFYKPEDLIKLLDKSKFALMPTRLDAQGVMMCELASYGMPIITSDISICKEMLEGYGNAYFIDNEYPIETFKNFLNSYNENLSSSDVLISRFDFNEIIDNEVKVILGESI